MNINDSVLEIISNGEYVKPEYIIGNYPNSEIRNLVKEIVRDSELIVYNDRKISSTEFGKQLLKKYSFLNRQAIKQLYSWSFFANR